MQEELRASEAKFAGILAIAADAIITVDSSHRIVHFNRGAEEIFGYAEADVLGRHLNILLPVRFREAHEPHMDSFARSPVTARRMGERREIFGLHADGTEFPAEASISKLVSRDGILFTVVLRDITQQRRAEENERFLSGASAELAQTLALDSTIAAIADLPVPRLADAALVDLVRGASYVRTTSRRHRPDLAEAMHTLGDHALTPDSPSPIVDAIRRSRAELTQDVDDEWLERYADPETLDAWRALGAQSLLTLPLVAGGETLGALTLIRTTAHGFDEGQRAIADQYAQAAASALQNAASYEAARQANRARDEVLGVVSHDLRNPLSAIAMCARVLEESSIDDAGSRRELLGTIRSSTETMNRMIDDLLDVANIERGRLSLELDAREPAELVLRAIHMFDVESREHGIRLETALPTNLPLVRADAARIVQVLANLLRNAIKFTPEGGEIRVSVERKDSSVVFSVRDSGRGISTEDQRHIFDRYWQSAAGARTRGTGLGLSIAQGIVQAHGGRIWVESTLGSGSTFAFTIPSAN